MVARRLIVALIVMLVVSSIAAALLPAPHAPRRASLPPTTTTSTARARPAGRYLTERVNAAAGKPEVIRLRAGDQLQLTVSYPRADQVEVAGFGQVESVGPFDPATFNLLATAPGAYPVRLLSARRTVATLEVSRPGRSNRRPSPGAGLSRPRGRSPAGR